MDSDECQYAFKETRLSLEASSSSFIVNVRVPDLGNSRGSHHRHVAEKKETDAENAFASKNLAPWSSIFRRRLHTSPQSFLWRRLENGLVLNIRAIDIYREEVTPEAPYILNFLFEAPLQPGCVALAEGKHRDALCIFALTESGNLYSLTLNAELFRRKASDNSMKDGLTVSHHQSLSGGHAHRLVAVDADRILFTLRDGSLVRLDRNMSGDSIKQPWIPTPFSPTTWSQNLRNLIPAFGGTAIKFGNLSVGSSAAVSAEISNAGLKESVFLFTVCVDHRLRAWSVATGQILHGADILGTERTGQDVARWTIDPSYSNLVRVVDTGPGQTLCVTFSPIGPGEFKFWNVVAKSDSILTIEDLFSEDQFVPNAPSLSDAWTMADFAISEVDGGCFNLWLLWKNNTTYRVHKLSLAQKKMAESWASACEAVFFENIHHPAQSSGPCDGTDTAERWLDAILTPGRFTKATLETALAIYERGLGKKPGDRPRGSKSLSESICSILGSTATLERGSTGDMDYAQFRSSSEQHWRRFFRLLLELDKQRGEAVSLALDTDPDMTWVVCADSISAIRRCSPLEKVYHNLTRPKEEARDQSNLIMTGLSFVDVIPDNMVQICNSVLRPELFDDVAKADLERIQYFFDKTGFWRGVTEDDCGPVVESLGQNFSRVTRHLYDQLFNLVEVNDFGRRPIRYPLTHFGMKLVVKAVQQHLELQWKVFFSQLVLLVHMEYEFDQEEDALHHRVDIGKVFSNMVNVLRRLELLRWLSKTELSVPPPRPERSGQAAMSPSASKRPVEEAQSLTAFECTLAHLVGFSHMTDEFLPESISEMVANLCSPDSDFEISPTNVQCMLMKMNRPDVAMELMPFTNQMPFSVYVQGRVFLSLREYAEAAILFKKAAIGMSVEDAEPDRHSVGLLGDMEWKLLNNGMAKYYGHIVSLFEKQKAYSYVIEFARLALQFASSASATDEPIRTEMLSRHFTAAVAISHFSEAHSALLAMSNKAMQRSSLRKLVDRMCEGSHNTELTTLPFLGLDAEVDEVLEQKCRAAQDMRGTPYHRVLYAWRISRNDYRGAANVLMSSIQKLKFAGEGDKPISEDMLDTPVTKQYLLLINALTCVDEKQAWIFSEAPDPSDGKRKVVTLADVRKEYQDELDRIAAIQNNQFGFELDDEMDIL